MAWHVLRYHSEFTYRNEDNKTKNILG